MSNNSYNDFKSGIKKDISYGVQGLFWALGLFLLIITIIVVFLWFFYRGNHYSIETKAVVGISIIVFTIALFTSRKFSNLVYRCWLALLVVIFIGVCIGIIGVLLWGIYETCPKDFF